jgi:hypothetical protein
LIKDDNGRVTGFTDFTSKLPNLSQERNCRAQTLRVARSSFESGGISARKAGHPRRSFGSLEQYVQIVISTCD